MPLVGAPCGAGQGDLPPDPRVARPSVATNGRLNGHAQEHAILRRYPVIGQVRYGLEKLRPEIQQYFIERNWDGRPCDRDIRSVIYQRAKGTHGVKAFGTERDAYDVGHEYLVPATYPAPMPDEPPHVTVGGPDCARPYSMSLMNVSAISCGAPPKNAAIALDRGAAMGGLDHDTGEGACPSTTLSMEGTLRGKLAAATLAPASSRRAASPWASNYGWAHVLRQHP